MGSVDMIYNFLFVYLVLVAVKTLERARGDSV
jgi:hypothetical protein